jgi:two-component system, OmpR family, response regulator
MAGPKILLVDDNTELLALLAKMLEDAGYTPMPFSRGKPALEKARLERPALAVLDVLLPDIMGYEVAAACRKELSIPVVFITGVFKGGRHATDAKLKYDALGYFEKPFEASLLLEAIAKVVKPAKKERKKTNPPSEVAIDIDVDAGEEAAVDDFDVTVEIDERADGSDPMELTGRINIKEIGGLSATLSGAKLTAAPAHAAPPPPRKTPSRPPSPSPKSRPPPPPADVAPRGVKASETPSAGTLGDNLPALFTAFYQAQKTGELSLTRGKVKKVVYFEHGQPVFALSNVASDRFGQFLVRVGKITDPQLAEAMAKARPEKRRTGDVLLDMGLLKETEKLYYVGQQVKAIIYSLFAWEDGQYRITFQDRATAQALKLDLPPAMIILRGVKKLYKPDRLRRLVGEGQLRASRDLPYQMSEVPLEPWEAQLLAALDGTKTVKDAVAFARRPENAVLATLAALLALRFVERA